MKNISSTKAFSTPHDDKSNNYRRVNNIKPEVHPFRRLNLEAGLGSAFYRNRKDLVPSGVRDRPDVDAVYLGSQLTHRKFSINYNVRLNWEASNRFNIFFQQQGNLTSISKPVQTSVGEIDTGARWVNNAIGFSYMFHWFKKHKRKKSEGIESE